MYTKTIYDIHNIHKYVNNIVNITCFAYNTRIHKHIAFLVIRKNHKYIQCLTKENELINTVKQLPLESVVNVTIKIVERQQQNIRTNNIEDKHEGIILNIKVIHSAQLVPFNLDTSDKNNDEIREQYRYLDLRNKVSAQCIIFRHKVTHYIRQMLTKQHFVEIETPIITGSTPEGAKDFKVYGEKDGYYVLPQSPQIFKQLLMLSDFTKYFQIAKCFRDENTRKNRLPCEFTQLDVEFECDNINKLISTMLKITKSIFRKFTHKTLKVYKYSYTYIMNKYRSDKINILLAQQYNFFIRKNILYFQHYNVKKLTLFLQSKVKTCTLNNSTYYTYDTEDVTYNEFLTILNEDSKHLNSYCILIIFKFPYYELKNGELTYAHNLFSKLEDNVQTHNMSIQDKLQLKTLSCDCIINGQEVASGSIRSSINIDNIKSFNFLYDIYKQFPTFTHGGFAIGLERLLSLLQNDNNIKNYVSFFKLNNGTSTLPLSPT